MLATNKFNCFIMYVLWTLISSETWLSGICFYHKIFLDSLTILRSDSASKTQSSLAILTSVSSAFGTFKRRHDLQVYNELCGLKFPPKQGCSLPLIITIPPNTKPELISKYFCTLDKNLDTKVTVFLIGYFRAANFHWLSVLPYQIAIFIHN